MQPEDDAEGCAFHVQVYKLVPGNIEALNKEAFNLEFRRTGPGVHFKAQEGSL